MNICESLKNLIIHYSIIKKEVININLDFLNEKIFIQTFKYIENIDLQKATFEHIMYSILNHSQNKLIKYQSYYIDNSIKKLAPIYLFHNIYYIDTNYENKCFESYLKTISVNKAETVNQAIYSYINTENNLCSYLLKIYPTTFELFILDDFTVYYINDINTDIINLLYFLPIETYNIQLVESFITLHRLEQ